MKDVVELAKAGLDRQFATLDKEVKSFSTALDVSVRTLSKMLGGDKSKARKLKAELVDSIGHPYIGTESDFVLASTTQKLKKAKRIINKYTQDFSEEDLLNTRQEARGELVLKKSRQSGARLKDNIDKYFKDIERFTSPDLVSELKTKSNDKISKIKLSFTAPTGHEFRALEKKAKEAILTGIDYGKSADVLDVLDSKIELMAEIAKLGKEKAHNRAITRIRKQTTRNIRKHRGVDSYTYNLDGEDYEAPKPVTNLSTTLTILLQQYLATNNRHSIYPVMHAPTDILSPNKNYLRNRTYRFATTASVSSAIENDGKVDITYSYMRFPYEVFTKGVHGPGRNPENIISGAIRDIMKEIYANMRIRSLHLL